MTAGDFLRRFRAALRSLAPDEMLITFRHYRRGEVVEKPFEPHEDHRFVKVHGEDLGEVMARCNREFGDPTKHIGGPRLPRHRRRGEKG